MQRSIVREEKYDRKDILNSNLTVFPVNLTIIEGGLFDDVEKNDTAANEILEINRLYLSEVKNRIQRLRVNYRVSGYQDETADFFNKTWDDLNTDRAEKGIRKQPKLSKFLRMVPKSYISDEMSSHFERDDYILLYKVDYTAYTNARKAGIAVSLAPLILLAAYGGRAVPNDGKSHIFGDVASLQFILISRKENAVKCFGEYTEQKRDGKQSLRNSAEKMIKYIFEKEESE